MEPDDLAAAGARDLPRSQQVDKLGDKGARQGRDLIQVDCAVVRELEAPEPPSDCQGRRFLLVAEQVDLATPNMFDPTVHLDERVRLPRRSGMEEACQDVLADAGLAPDQQGNPGARTLSYRHEVEDVSSFQDGRYPFGRRGQSGHLAGLPGSSDKPPCNPTAR